MAAAWILNLIFAAIVVLYMVGTMTYAALTQHRDHGAVAAGPPHRRYVWSRHRRTHAGSRRPLYASTQR